MKTYNKIDSLDNITNLISTKNLYLICLSIIIFLISLAGFTSNMNKNYVDDISYPIEAVKWIKKNLDVDNLRIYNQFNYGSYLELNGIKVFIDSRSGIYCEEFSDTDVMNDYLAIEDGNKNYKEIFDKYDITHVLLYNNCLINNYICYDSNYECIYQDDNFVLYEKKVDI